MSAWLSRLVKRRQRYHALVLALLNRLVDATPDRVVDGNGDHLTGL